MGVWPPRESFSLRGTPLVFPRTEKNNACLLLSFLLGTREASQIVWSTDYLLTITFSEVALE